MMVEMKSDAKQRLGPPGGDSTHTEAELSPLREWLKTHLAGRMLAAVRRRRRMPLLALRALRAEREDRRGGRILPTPPARRGKCRAIVCIPAGPGSRAALFDTIDSVLASDQGASQIVVIDDCSVDCREAVVRERYPEVDVVRTRAPSGGPPNLWPPLLTAFEHVLRHYDFDILAKLDTDALVTGPGFSERAIERLDAVPETGIAGSFLTRADGRPEGHEYEVEVLERELPRDPVLSSAVERAEAAGWRRGDAVQGGAMFMTREACERLKREGWLEWRRPWHSIAPEDLTLTIFVRACGLEALSLGAPADAFVAVANKGLPLSKEELADGPWVAAHSVRAGLDGESEDELREWFRARRMKWPGVAIGAKDPAPAP